MIKKIINIAIIAHVDHGKTTLIDKLLQQSKNIKENKNIFERIMDSNDLEKERGITIFSKHTSVNWKNYKINIVDTPGHADFGGEVERVMSMVDSVLLLVDAIDGPMPQTYFVTKKAFLYGLKPIIIINKIDMIGSRPEWVIEQIFDLFINLDATEEQLDFPIVYTSALKGISGTNLKKLSNNMKPLFKSIIKNINPINFKFNEPFQMQISQLDYDNYKGTIGIGRINRGIIKQNENIAIINKYKKISYGKISNIFQFIGLKKKETLLAKAGDIIAITGLNKIKISDTLCNKDKIEALPPLKIDKPTISIIISVNNSPFSGKEGKFITSRQIFERLNKELNRNVSLKIKKLKNNDSFLVSGRGELHLSILIENMRREGFEMSISKPKVIYKEINKIKHEPFNLVTLDIKKKHQGLIIKEMGLRKGKMSNMIINKNNRMRLDYIIPCRSLIGFRNFFLNITSGSGLFHSTFLYYKKFISNFIYKRKNGVLISNNRGKTTSYSLFNLQNRGKLFVNSGIEVYEGQIIGLHNRSNDLTVNCISGKKLTNMRASGTDEAINLIPVDNITLEKAIEFINSDELIEITPLSIRIRKIFLKKNQRKNNYF